MNQNIDESIFASQDGNDKKRKKKSGENDTESSIIPEPIEIKDLVKEFQGKLKILNRITFSFSNQDKTKFLVSYFAIKNFDLDLT